MSTTVTNSTTSNTEFQPSVWNNITWAFGYRTSCIGDYFTKLGDKLMGDEPEGVSKAWDRGYARGITKGRRQVIDVLVKCDAAKA